MNSSAESVIPRTPTIPSETSNLIDTQVSWLAFNARVLEEAANRRHPLLDRVHFLAIFGSNLDEFFMKRIGGLYAQLAAGITVSGPDAVGPKEQLARLRQKILSQLAQFESLYTTEILPELKEEGVELLRWDDLTEDERVFAAKYFQEKIFPVLTPLAVDAGHPFPFISNLSSSLGVALGHPDYADPLFARVKVSGLKPQWIRLNPGAASYRLLHSADLIMAQAQALFPGMNILGRLLFRVTRNAELALDDEDAEDLMELIEEELRQRRVAQMVRLEYRENPDPWIRSFLLEELNLTEDQVYQVRSEFDATALYEIRALDIPRLKSKPWVPVTPAALIDEPSIFPTIRHRDILVHHPYESFSSSVERFIREAADDPEVLSIKMTVYRVGDKTPLIGSLIRAAEDGKHVVVLIELKARFEEQRNIEWALTMEQAGVHVVYGVPGMKTHAKTILVVRKDADSIRSYVHIGTGNYHAGNANAYTDLGLFTARPEITSEVVHFFNFLTGRSRKSDYQQLLVAPVNMEDRFLALIEREISNAQLGLPALIRAKMNGLDDLDMIRALNRASQAGVTVDLYVRGICALRPGIPCVSDRIRVRSIVGRFLEHSRMFYFANGASDPLAGDFFIGSADWMGRNLHKRVEIVVPIAAKNDRRKLWNIFEVLDQDNCQSWELNADSSYSRRHPLPGDPVLSSQERLMEQTREEEALHLHLP